LGLHLEAEQRHGFFNKEKKDEKETWSFSSPEFSDCHRTEAEQ
jgi:hypothetical protein